MAKTRPLEIRMPAVVSTPYAKMPQDSAKKSEDSTATAVTTTSKNEKRRDIDLMRLSQTVKKNIMKDNHEYSGQDLGKGSLILLTY